MHPTFAHGYALLIGVGQSAERRLSLPVTVKDMQALRQVLVNPNLCAYPDNDQHIRLLHDQSATKQAILAGLVWLKQQATADPEATVVVYYSGHGWLDTNNNRYYLLQHDVNAFDWQGSALASEDFNNVLHEIPAKRLLVIIDSCHAAGMATTKDGEQELILPPGVVATAEPKGLIEDLKQGEGQVVFTSCRSEQQSWIRPDNSMSVYTYHLIEALKGSANKPGETEVKVSNLMNYLGKAVPENARAMGKEQTPRFETNTEDFAIALLQGGKGLPAERWDAVQDNTTEQIQALVQASGDRSIAAGGVMRDNQIVQGDGNTVIHGINIGNARDVNLGGNK